MQNEGETKITTVARHKHKKTPSHDSSDKPIFSVQYFVTNFPERKHQ